MAPKLIKEGKIQILGQTLHSVVYAVASDSQTGEAKDSPLVLKGGTVCYENREALGQERALRIQTRRRERKPVSTKLLVNMIAFSSTTTSKSIT